MRLKLQQWPNAVIAYSYWTSTLWRSLRMKQVWQFCMDMFMKIVYLVDIVKHAQESLTYVISETVQSQVCEL